MQRHFLRESVCVRKIEVYEETLDLGVFSECVVAFCAAEELGRCFVSSARLDLPDINQHVAAFWALHPHGWHRVYLIFFSDDGHSFLKVVFYDFSAYFGFRCRVCSFYVSAFGAS